MVDKATKSIKPPRLGEQTKPQVPTAADVATLMATLPGFASALPGTFRTYRRMRANPAIAIARVAATAPIRAVEFLVTAEGAPADSEDFVRIEMERLWPQLIRDLLWSMDFGFQSFEKVFEIREGRVRYRKLKALVPDKTKVRLDKKDGSFRGLEQLEIELAADKAFWFVYDGEPGGWYGRSRHENIRENAWQPWIDTMKRLGQYVTKVAAVVPIIEYPLGVSRDKRGDEKSNYDLAVGVLNALGTAKGVTMPNVYAKYADDLARAGVDLQQLKAWHISFLEQKGNHGPALVQMLRYLDSLLARGWLVPERAILEGQHGTKAEAGTHAQFALMAADQFLADVLRDVNEYIVNPLLVLNWGEQARGTVKMEKAGLDPQTRLLFATIIEKVLAEPANISVLLRMVDFDAMIDGVGLPGIEHAPIEQAEPDMGEAGGEGAPTPEATSLVSRLYRDLGLVNRDGDEGGD